MKKFSLVTSFLLLLICFSFGFAQSNKEETEEENSLEFISGRFINGNIVSSFGDTTKDTRIIEVEIDPSFLIKKEAKNASAQKPDYKEYHTVIHLMENTPAKVIKKGGKVLQYVFKVNVGGKDPATVEQRRFALGTRPLGNTAVSLVGSGGTRLTFGGDKEHPLRIVPGILLWHGGLDIDYKLGVLIDQGTGMTLEKKNIQK